MISALRISNHDRTVFAGSSPATAGLAFMLSICRELHSQIPRTAHSASIRTNSLALTALQNHLCTRYFLRFPFPRACPNPHKRSCSSNPCGTAQALPLDAISCLGAFRTPAGGACGEVGAAGVRKPDQDPTMLRN